MAFRIDDNTAQPPDGMRRGYDGRDYSAYPFLSLKCARPSTVKRISKADRLEIIREKNAKKTWIKDICDARGSPVKNQQNSNYCWFHAPVRGIEVHYVLSGGPVLKLSAFYGAAIIKGGRNQGGSGVVACEFLSENGTCTEEFHAPMNFKVNRDAEAKANALLHVLDEGEEIDADDHETIKSAICADIGVTVGIPAWSHEVLLTYLNEDDEYGCDNSWGQSWGDNGRGILSARYSRFDEAWAVRSVTPSSK